MLSVCSGIAFTEVEINKMYFSVPILMYAVHMYISTNVLKFSECEDLNK